MKKIIDTRDLKERLEELESEYETLKETAREAQDELEEKSEPGHEDDPIYEGNLDEAKDNLKEFEDPEEFAQLKQLQEMAEDIPEWNYGNTLIPESEFVNYCMEMLEDIGDLPRNFPHYIVIDWEATAENLKADYSEVEYEGETYLYRNV